MIDDFKTSKALLDKLQIFADAQSYRIAIQGASFTPVTTETYLKETFLANETDPLNLAFDSTDRQDPIYQIDVYTPKGQGGKWPSQQIGNLLKEEFKRAPIFFNDGAQTIQITNVSGRLMTSSDTHNWYMINVDLVVLAANT
jgi:hypothetical protein